MLKYLRFAQIFLVVLTTSIGGVVSAQTIDWKLESSRYYFGKSFEEADTVSVRIIALGSYPRSISARIAWSGFSIVGDSVILLRPSDTAEIRIAYDALNFPTAGATLWLNNFPAVSLQGGNGPALTEVIVARDLDLGTPMVGHTVQKGLSIQNRSSLGRIMIKDITFEKGGKSDFILMQPLTFPIVVDSGKSTGVQIKFKNTYSDLRRVTDRLLVELSFEKDTRIFTRKITVSAGSLDCIELPRQLMMGGSSTAEYVWLDESVVDSLKITNPRSTPVTINGLYLNELFSFKVLTQFPLVIPPHDSTYLRFRWDATGVSNQNIVGKLQLGDCGEEPFTVDALYAIRLFNDENKLLNFDDAVDRRPYPNFTFLNDGTNPILVNSVRFAKDEDAYVFQDNFPRALDPGALTEIEFSFSASDHIVDDTILVEVDTRPEPLRFPFHAILRGFSSVQKQTPLIDVTLSPNPGRNRFAVSVKGGRATAIVVTDLLGRIVERPGPDKVIWDASSSPVGSYLIRVEGVCEKGTPFVRTLRAVRE